ncbi:MAG: hypothetical protein ACE5MM_00055 [Nitrospiraceae bacterium]
MGTPKSEAMTLLERYTIEEEEDATVPVPNRRCFVHISILPSTDS